MSIDRSAVLGPDLWLFNLRSTGSDADSTSLSWRFFPSRQAASERFVQIGNQLVVPVAVAYYAGSPPPPVHFDPPIISHTSFTALDQANFFWNGHGANARGVINFRQGRVIGQINAPSLADAERVGRDLVSSRSARKVAGSGEKARERRTPVKSRPAGEA